MKIGHNYRNIQERYGRDVFLRRPEDDDVNDHHHHYDVDRLTELHENLLEQEIALLESRRSGGAGLRSGVFTALLAAVGAAARLV